MAERPAAHAGAAGVEQRQQRRRGVAAQGQDQFQVALRRRRQIEQLAGTLHIEPAHVRERAALGALGVTEQCRRRRLCRVQVLRVEAGQACHLQLLAELAPSERGVELPRALRRDGQA